MTKNKTPTPVYLDPGMHPGLEVKGLNEQVQIKIHSMVCFKKGASFFLKFCDCARKIK